MTLLSLIFNFCCMLFLLAEETAAYIDPDAYRNVSELITSRGYRVEEHKVVTVDGYVLSIQRIPYGRNENTHREGKEVVLLLHGEVGDSKTWFLNPPGQGLGYILPDEGYDVWMVNDRGSEYSHENIYYPTRSFRFWNFTLEDIAKYDATVTIDYVLNATGKDSLRLIGYSRGNTIGFILLSEVPEYNKKVKFFAALAPIAFIGNFRTLVRLLIPFAEPIYFGLTAVTQGEFLHTNKALRIAIYKFCKVQKLDLCEQFIFAIGGVDREYLNKTRVPIYLSQYISSTSTKILLHYAQLFRSKSFRYFDYGPLLNLKHYNQLTPPDFKLSQISAPVALFSSARDTIADTLDVLILRSKLNSVVLNYRVPGGVYNHLDFIWGEQVENIVYKPLLDQMRQY